jgi:TonB-linked SusC/RagA family outer membrane protein
MTKILLFLGALLFLQTAHAQDLTLSGTIRADDGTSLPGVSIVVKGTSIGTVSDIDGKYTIAVPPSARTLVFSFIGYKAMESDIVGRTVIDMQLSSDTQQLTEVVVVGYGSQIKQELTGNIAQVSSEDLENVPVTTMESAIQGRASGVYINQGSGKLGQGMSIRIRGASSVSASNQPLFVIDNIIVNSADPGLANDEPINPMADINPNDIESISILKDAAAAAIYGSRASNGVVIVTTKKGTVGRTKVNIGYYAGVSTPTRKREFLNAAQYRELFTAAAENMGYNVEDEFAGESGTDDWANNYDTNWSNEAFQTGGVQQYDASVSGGDLKTRFFVSMNYNDQKGIILGNEFSRASGRINLDHKISDKFTIGTNLSLVKSVNKRVSDDNAFSNPVQLNALPPLHPKYDPATGKLNTATLYYNALLDNEYGFNVGDTYRSISNVFLDFKITPDLVFRTEHGLDYLNLQEEVYLGKETEDGGPSGYGYNNQFTSVNYTTNSILTFSKTLNEVHKLQMLAGYSYQQGVTSNVLAEGRGFPGDRFKKIVSAARITDGSSAGAEYLFNSYFFRGNYSFNGKYLFAASLRTDGSSRFGKENQYGLFPSVSGGWILTEEGFLEESNLFSFLKLRASYGVTGNAEIGNFASRALYQAGLYSDVAGVVPQSLPNDGLKWEKTTQVDLGLDFGLFNDRITGEIDYYVKETNDLLLDVPLPSVNGFTTITKNVGRLSNKGVEVVINTENLVGEFRWSTSFNISHNVNNVSDLNGAVIFGGARFLGQIREGEPMAVFYGPKYAGVDPANGDALYYIGHESNETTNDISLAADQRVGNPNPKFFGGLDNKFAYKGFDFSVLTQFVYGNDIYNIAGIFQAVNGDYFDNHTVDQMRYWRQPGDVTDIPQPRLYESNGTGKSSRWVQDGSFLRIKLVSLGYTIPKSVLSKTFLSSARIYLTASNLFTFTGYDGYDPEVNTSYIGLSNVTLGHDFYTPPLPKTITAGVTLGL